MDRPVSLRTMRETIGLPAIVSTDVWCMGTKCLRTSSCAQAVPSRSQVSGEINLRSGFLLGQVISVMIALASMSAASLDDRGVNLPSFVNLMNYSLITLAFLTPMVLRSRTLKLPWWRYALYALVDVEANTMTVLAYRFTSITSITMLDAFSIPSVMVFSRLFLRAHYTRAHLTGVMLCLGGLALTVVSDMKGQDPQDGTPRAVAGDLLCILGASLYAAANVMQENFVKNHDRTEFLAMTGLFGVLLSGVQTLVLEWEAIAEVEWTQASVLFMIGYASSLFVMYSWTSLFLQASDAALFNLSLLTADIYALIFSYLVEHNTPNWLYFAAAAVIFTGLFVYHAQPPVTVAEPLLPEVSSERNALIRIDPQGREGVPTLQAHGSIGVSTVTATATVQESRDDEARADNTRSYSDTDVMAIIMRTASDGSLAIL